jgi:transcriptional regulator with XRE-family HTH domain
MESSRRKKGHVERWPNGVVTDGLPDVGEIIRRLRVQRGLSLHDVAERTGISASFLSAVELGKSDIALKRLARLARFYGHDVGSLLGYSQRQAEPHFIPSHDRVKVNRGRGVDYEVIRLGGLNLEFITATLQPKTRFKDQITHEGVDFGYCALGQLVLVYNDVAYVLNERDAAIWSGAYPHLIRNDSDKPAQFVSITTETVF